MVAMHVAHARARFRKVALQHPPRRHSLASMPCPLVSVVPVSLPRMHAGSPTQMNERVGSSEGTQEKEHSTTEAIDVVAEKHEQIDWRQQWYDVVRS